MTRIGHSNLRGQWARALTERFPNIWLIFPPLLEKPQIGTIVNRHYIIDSSGIVSELQESSCLSIPVQYEFAPLSLNSSFNLGTELPNS